jgi:hypothetical protein
MMPMLAEALLVGYVPGAVIFRWPGRTKARRAALPCDERLFWAVLLSAIWSLVVVLALAAAGRYTFGTLLAINGAIGLVGLLAWPRLRYSAPADRNAWPLVVPIAIVALGAWLYFPAAEYIIGGKDPGSYLNEGIQIAQRGQLIAADPTIASVPSDLRDLFFPSHDNPTYYGLRFVGYYVRNPDTGAVIGQFPQLYPAAIAIGYGMNGLSGARQAGPIWAILGLLAVYYAGATWFGRPAAAAAALLLGLNVVEVWFARYPTTEVVMQALTFAALLAFTRQAEWGGLFFGTLAGTLASTLLFLRYDAILVIGALAATAALLPVIKQRAGAGFWVGLLTVGLLGFWYLLGPMSAYMQYPAAFMRNTGALWLVGTGVVSLVILPRLLSRAGIAALVHRALPLTLAVVMVALATYAYFFRAPAGRLALADAMAFRAFAWYVTTPVLALAVAGFAWSVWRSFWRAPAFFVTLSLFSVFFFYKIRIAHEHLWASRRLLPVILPGALLLVTALLDTAVGQGLWARLRSRGVPVRLGAFAGAVSLAVATGLIGMSFWRATDPVAHHVEYAGLIPEIERLSARFGDRDLLLLEGRNAGSDLHVLGMPLAYIYARNVLVLDSPVPSKRQLERFVHWARAHYDNVWFLGGGGTDLLTATVGAEPVSSEKFRVPEYATAENAYPTGIRQKEFDYGIYRLTPRAATARGPIDLSIGDKDDVNVVRFHAKEFRADIGLKYRWTGPLSYVLLQGSPPGARTLTIWLSSGGRPSQAPAPEVSVTLEHRELGRVTPSDEVRPYAFAIPADLATALATSDDPARLELRVSTWNPAELLGATDTRNLGVILTRVTIQ